jgi:hypothetical protein
MILRDHLIFMETPAGEGNNAFTVFNEGHLIYLGKFTLAPGDEVRLPQDPRYRFLDSETGLIQRYSPPRRAHVKLAHLAELFLPDVPLKRLQRGVWLDCQPPRDEAGTPGGIRWSHEMRTLRELYQPVADDFGFRIAQGKRCFFTQESASRLLTYALVCAIADPALAVKDWVPSATISADPEQPHFSDGG